MSTAFFYAFVGVLILIVGMLGAMLNNEPIKKILSLNIFAGGIFLTIVGFAQKEGVSDPLAQAMVLTGIVVSFGATALGIAIIRAIVKSEQ